MEPPTHETGEWRIKILCPNKPIVPDPAYPDDPHKRIDIVTSYSIGHVYDILQTEGEPLPKPPRPELLTARSEAGSSLYRRLERYATDQGVRVIHQDTGSANGWYVLTKREIANGSNEHSGRHGNTTTGSRNKERTDTDNMIIDGALIIPTDGYRRPAADRTGASTPATSRCR
jgi:hypothetical protein